MIAACVPNDELGQVYALWSSMDNLIPLAVAQIYKEIWEVTQSTYTGTIYMVSAYSSSLAYCICIYIAIQLKGKDMSEVTGMKALREAMQKRQAEEAEREKVEISEIPTVDKVVGNEKDEKKRRGGGGGRHIALPPAAYRDDTDSPRKFKKGDGETGR